MTAPTLLPLPPERTFALTGDIDGVSYRCPLVEGVNCIGHDRANGVCIPIRGVSRRHALLTVSEGCLVLEDLSSKNGCYINGERVEQGEVKRGDVLRFGPAVLRIERIVALDAEIAIRLESPVRGDEGSLETSTFHAGGASSSLRYLTVVEDFIESLCSPSGGISGALSALTKGLGADAAVLLRRSADATPAVLSWCNEFSEAALEGALESCRNKEFRTVMSDGDITVVSSGGQGPCCSCFSA